MHRSVVLAFARVDNRYHRSIVTHTLDGLSLPLMAPQCSRHNDGEELLDGDVDRRPGFWPLELEPFTLGSVCTTSPVT